MIKNRPAFSIFGNLHLLYINICLCPLSGGFNYSNEVRETNLGEIFILFHIQFSSVQFSRVRLFVTHGL